MSEQTAVQSQPALSAGWLAILGVFVAVAFLATGGIFVRLSALDPIATGAWRVVLAVPLAYLWVLAERPPGSDTLTPSGRPMVILWLAGVFLGLDLALWNISFTFTTVANANLLANMVPFVVVPAAWLLYGEKVNAKFLGGLFLAVAGVVLLLSGKVSASDKALMGDALALATALFYGLYLLTVSRLRRSFSAAQVMYYSSFGCLSVLVPLAVLLEKRLIPGSAVELLPLLGLAALSHVGGQGLLAQCLKYVPAALSSVLVLTQPLIAAVYAWLLFQEVLGQVEIAGIAVCLAGINLAKRSQG
jgi:drug/metabolite transporter (DMT)-like permease